MMAAAAHTWTEIQERGHATKPNILHPFTQWGGLQDRPEAVVAAKAGVGVEGEWSRSRWQQGMHGHVLHTTAAKA
jgi:hypothetical protein